MPYAVIAAVVILILIIFKKRIAQHFRKIGNQIRAMAGKIISVIAVVLAAIIVALFLGALGAVPVLLVGLFAVFFGPKIWNSLRNTIREHDERRKEVASIKRETDHANRIHRNQTSLQSHLERSCRELGYMDDRKWEQKLKNYAGKEYETSFTAITRNFARQMEHQNILQNDDWFQPFLQYIINHPQGSTVTKMLNEVRCRQLKYTHCTPDGDLLNTKLVQGTRRKNADVPPLFESVFLSEMNESLFTPTKYALKLYGNGSQSASSQMSTQEFSIDDL